MHFFFQLSSSSFCNTCPYNCCLFCCYTNAMSSIHNLSLSTLLGNLSFSLNPHVHLTILISAHLATKWLANSFEWLLIPILVSSIFHLILILIDYWLVVPSVLWRCWLGGRKGIRPVKNWVVGWWCGYLSGAQWRLAYGPADATASCCSKIQIGFTFLVPAHPGSPGKRAVKRVCVCVVRGC